MVIFWFRQDLRLKDNPGLNEAFKQGEVLPIYILDDINSKKAKMGGASRVWLYYALEDLNESLDGKLQLFAGDPTQVFQDIIKEHQVDAVIWNRCYEPWRISRDTKIKKNLQDSSIEVNSFNGSLLWEPWEVLKSDGTPYKVFTPYYKRGCLSRLAPRQPLTPKKNRMLFSKKLSGSVQLSDLNLLPEINWDEIVVVTWEISESGGHKRLKQFVNHSVNSYKSDRDFPAVGGTSLLSPYLHFGQLSPNQIWYASFEKGSGVGLQTYHSELGWREFSYYLLFHFPQITNKNFNTKFDGFVWENSTKFLKSWQKGLTGYPIIDAGMRQLWQTGYMHNRVRMIVASFLTKNLLIDWRKGEKWFWDCLFDADLASNCASWQWVAGSGADAAPYFRIFNPVTQSKKFDVEGEYIRRYIPELKDVPAKFIHEPWLAPSDILKNANVIIGKTYPHPIVDLKETRERALQRYKALS